MTDFEKGSAAWDIGIILTRHATGNGATQGQNSCSRVLSLRITARNGTPAERRLSEALATPCSCDAGDSDSEKTSILKEDPNGSAVPEPAIPS